MTEAVSNIKLTSGSQLTERVKTNFVPYVHEKPVAQRIRKDIAEHIEALRTRLILDVQETGTTRIPQYVKGTRREFIRAVNALELAKLELSCLQNQHRVDMRNEPNLQTSQILSLHLDTLVLQKQNRHYDLLSHCMSEAEEITEQHDTRNAQVRSDHERTNETQNHSPASASLSDEMETLTKELETALLQADLQLRREQDQLLRVKSRSIATKTLSNAAKLQAMSSARVELTQWIETSLASCDEETNATEKSTEETTTSDIEPSKIDEWYDKYLAVRSGLLSAASSLFQLVASPPSQGRPRSNPMDANQPVPIVQTSTNVKVQQLRQLEQKELLEQYDTHLKRAKSKASQQLREELERLRDESHLLPSYPILSGRRTHEREVSNHIHVQAPAKNNEASQLLDAWKFAIMAATTATEAMIEKEQRQGESSVEEVAKRLHLLHLQNGSWSRLNSENESQLRK